MNFCLILLFLNFNYIFSKIFIVPSSDTPTIQSAIAQAGDNDRIIINQGSYSDPIVLPPTWNKRGVILQGSLPAGPFPKITGGLYFQSNVLIDGITFRYIDFKGGNDTWIVQIPGTVGPKNINFEECSFTAVAPVLDGLNLQKASGKTTFKQCLFTGFATTMVRIGSGNCLFNKNEVTKSVGSIELSNLNQVEFNDNSFEKYNLKYSPLKTDINVIIGSNIGTITGNGNSFCEISKGNDLGLAFNLNNVSSITLTKTNFTDVFQAIQLTGRTSKSLSFTNGVVSVSKYFLSLKNYSQDFLSSVILTTNWWGSEWGPADVIFVGFNPSLVAVYPWCANDKCTAIGCKKPCPRLFVCSPKGECVCQDGYINKNGTCIPDPTSKTTTSTSTTTTTQQTTTTPTTIFTGTTTPYTGPTTTTPTSPTTTTKETTKTTEPTRTTPKFSSTHPSTKSNKSSSSNNSDIAIIGIFIVVCVLLIGIGIAGIVYYKRQSSSESRPILEKQFKSSIIS